MPKFAKYPSLDGQTVFVSGGGSGIGADIVTAFAEQGARVGFVDIDAAAGERVLDKIADLGGQAHFEQLDLRDVGAIKEGFARMIARLALRWRWSTTLRATIDMIGARSMKPIMTSGLPPICATCSFPHRRVPRP